jgi:DNA-binding NtrC family response regulator
MEFILLVEDDADVRQVMKEMLTGSAFTILEAGSAAEALKVLRKAGAHIGVLVTDVRMPGILDGLDLASMAQNSWPWIKVIVTTAFADSVAERLPPNVRFLPKPWWPEEMLGHIQSASAEFEKIQAAALMR